MSEDWQPARVVLVEEGTRNGRPLLSLELELLEGPYKGTRAKDSVEPLSVWHQCHTDTLWKALGNSSPREGDRLEIRTEGRSNDLRVRYKGYRRARGQAG